MFKAIGNVFKGNWRLERAFSLAETEFQMYPKRMVKQMPRSMATQWRQQFRAVMEQESLNDWECAVMLVVPFVGLITDPEHKMDVEYKMTDWWRKDLIRDEVYFEFRNNKDNKQPFDI
ncbi:hypothetical protein R4K02_25135 [Pseudomonas aeruginosa]|uniref:hypothetical protein n=1 Tax=Pseudomonas aeruginosa TaxID=287 RepID=UPI0029559931|nr:hypothetical protein [Pseudomonas aeruginosa]MDV7980370.1 hypothetical protein [Pseudomonas aeruginosa]